MVANRNTPGPRGMIPGCMPEWERLRVLEGRVQRLREEIITMVVELEEMRVALERTKLSLNARLGHMYIELGQLDLDVRKQRFRQELRAIPRLSEQEIDGLIEARFEQEAAKLASLREDRETNLEGSARNQKMERLTPETVRSIKKLYRRLAKRFHPDLHGDDGNRSKLQAVMAQINACYRGLDLQGLLDIEDGVMVTIVTRDESAIERSMRLKKILPRLREILRRSREELEALKRHELHEIMQEIEKGREEGRDALAELEKDLECRIAARRRELESLAREPSDKN